MVLKHFFWFLNEFYRNNIQKNDHPNNHIYFILFYECLPKKASSILLRCDQWGSCLTKHLQSSLLELLFGIFITEDLTKDRAQKLSVLKVQRLKPLEHGSQKFISTLPLWINVWTSVNISCSASPLLIFNLFISMKWKMKKKKEIITKILN